MATRQVQSPWLTVAEAAAYLRTSPNKVVELLNKGEVPSYMPSATTRRRLVNTSDLDAWMRSQPTGAKVPEALRSA